MGAGRPRLAEVLLLGLRQRALEPSPTEDGVVSVRLGTFDADPGIRPQWRQFVAYAAPWEPMPDDGLPRYDERPPA